MTRFYRQDLCKPFIPLVNVVAINVATRKVCQRQSKARVTAGIGINAHLWSVVWFSDLPLALSYSQLKRIIMRADLSVAEYEYVCTENAS